MATDWLAHSLDRFTMRVILEWPEGRSGGSFKHYRRIAQLAEQLTLKMLLAVNMLSHFDSQRLEIPIIFTS